MISLLLLILLFNPHRELESENAGLRMELKRLEIEYDNSRVDATFYDGELDFANNNKHKPKIAVFNHVSTYEVKDEDF